MLILNILDPRAQYRFNHRGTETQRNLFLLILDIPWAHFGHTYAGLFCLPLATAG